MSFLLSRFRKPKSFVTHANLVPAVKALISVLGEVDKYPALYLNQAVLREAIRRYEHIWIPLLARTPPAERVNLVPPLDVEWVWVCHMLCPVKYAVDSAAIWKVSRPNETNYLLDHKLSTGKARRDGKASARALWERHFRNEPFDIMASIKDAPTQEDEASDLENQENSTVDSKISYDIALAAGRQMAFHYQVAIMPQYGDDKFLRAAVKRYTNFLKLQEQYPEEIWVPTYDIDVTWHAHMMHPRLYHKETKAMRGTVLPHDDTLNDRSPKSNLNERWDATRTKWFKLFGEHVARDGGMWRGNVEGEERVLTPRVVASIRDIEAHMTRSRETLYSVWDEARARDETLDGTGWIHRTDWRRRNPGNTDLSNSENVVERYTFLSSRGERNPLLMCRTSHFVMYDMKGTPGTFCSTVEIYDNLHHAQNNERRYPLATAHHALPQTVCVGKQFRKDICSLVPGETTFVLRTGGEDFALICARWISFHAPTKNVSGDPGELALRIWLLGKNIPGQWICVSRSGSRREPGLYSFQLPYQSADGVAEDSVSFNLANSTVNVGVAKNAIPTYLICMVSAVFHVALQPKFEPRGGVCLKSAETMYPAWGVQQSKYDTLRGAGGESLVNGRNTGLPNLQLFLALKRSRTRSLFKARMNDIA